MKHPKLQSLLISTLLSFFLGFGATGCMVTGLKLDVPLVLLGFFCLLLSLVLSAIFCSRHSGKILLGITVAFLVLLVPQKVFRQQLYSMLYEILFFYHSGYGIPIPSFLQNIQPAMHLLPLLTIHAIVACACSWALADCRPATPAVLLSVMCVGSCCVVTDTVPSLGFITVWLFALVMLLISHPTRLRNEVQGIRLTRLLAIPVAAAMLAMAVLIPQSSYIPPNIPTGSFEALFNWASSKLPFVGKTHEGEVIVVVPQTNYDRVSLKSLGPRNPISVPVMEVTADFSGPLYLRKKDFDNYSGTDWQATTDRTEDDFTLPGLWSKKTGTINIRTYGHGSTYFLPYYPNTAPTLTGGSLVNEHYESEYSFNCITLTDGWEAAWRQGLIVNPQPTDPRYKKLPADTLREAKIILSQTAINSSRDELAQAQRIEAYVQSLARYDLNTPTMPEDQDDFALWFLREAESGYCVHYATAATVLLRASGIPARYVEGYLTPGKKGSTVIIRENQAHAWVEYYIDGIGWLIMDPTPSDSSTPDQNTPSTPPTSSTTPPGPTPSTTTKPTGPTDPNSTTLPTQTTPPTQPSGIGGGSAEGDGQATGWILWGLAILVSLGLAVLALLGQYNLRRKWLYRRMHRGKTNAQALIRYKEARRLARLSYQKLPAELTALAEKACFSQHRLTPDELAQFDHFMADCTAAMQEMRLLRRLYLRYIRAAI